MKNSYIERLIIREANFIIENNATVRETAQAFGVSKTTVHKHVTKQLKKFNLPLQRKVQKVLDINKAESHIRGGLATKKKFEGKKKTN